jgi:hypothetical protein
MTRRMTAALTSAGVACLVFALAGCGNKEEPSTTPPPEAAPPSATSPASPGAPATPAPPPGPVKKG